MCRLAARDGPAVRRDQALHAKTDPEDRSGRGQQDLATDRKVILVVRMTWAG